MLFFVILSIIKQERYRMQQKRLSLIGIFLAISILLVGMWCVSIDNRYVGAVGGTVSVTFDSNGGGQVNFTTLIVGEEYVLPTPNYSGRNFLGWYYNSQRVETEGDSWEINQPQVNLVAQWELIEYNIVYSNIEGINGVNPNPTSYNVTDVIILQEVSRDGYVFGGWYDGVASEVTIIENKVGNLVLEATWTIIPYSITYDGLEGVETNLNPTTYTVESEITLSEVTKLGFEFKGWYTNPNDENTKVTRIEEGTTGNITLTALWKVAEYIVKYENDEYPEQIVMYGETLNELYTPTKEGYIFGGWYIDSTFRVKFTTDTQVTEDITLYAKWIKKTNPIWFVLCGGLAFVAMLGWVVYIIKRKKDKAQGYEL